MRTPAAFVSSLALLLSACGGGGGSGSVSAPPGGGTSAVPTPAPSASPINAACSLRARQDWAAAQLDEWYLFPETLPAAAARNPAGFASVSDYVDSLTATARSQSRDRYFTHVTSIAEENAYYASGSSAGFGFRLANDGSNRVFVIESYEDAPAIAAGIDRGAEIVGIGTTTANIRSVAAIVAAEGFGGVTNALGPSDVGVARVLRIADAGGTRTVTLAKTEFALTPVSARYGAKIIDDGGRRIGYLNLRTFISTAQEGLRSAFALFRTSGVSDVIVDLRYNGGGLVSVAELMGDLLGGKRTSSDVFSYTSFRASKASENEVDYFGSNANAIAPARIAFIGTGGTASASELVINAFIPYYRADAGLIGGNTYGKPVGQIAIDRAECDDRLRVVAFATENAAHQGAYFTGLARTVEASCRAADNIAYPLGDPRESMTRAALDFIAGRPCTPIATSTATQSLRTTAGEVTPQRMLLTPDRPTPAQREAPGTF